VFSELRSGLAEKARELPRLGVSVAPLMGNCAGAIREVTGLAMGVMELEDMPLFERCWSWLRRPRGEEEREGVEVSPMPIR
jgi:hypothetical protein